MDWKGQAQLLFDEYLKPQGIKDERVKEAFLTTPRHEFVPKDYQTEAYLDMPLPIGQNQTISQPSLVASMTQLLKLKGTEKVLEIGTGSGYQAAILSQLAKEVYTVELLPQLAKQAQKTLFKLGYDNVHVQISDGSFGLEKSAPYDAIIVTAGAKLIPPSLVEQLKEGGRIIIPVGESLYDQILTVGIKKHGKLKTKSVEPVAFVPLVGKYSISQNPQTY